MRIIYESYVILESLIASSRRDDSAKGEIAMEKNKMRIKRILLSMMRERNTKYSYERAGEASEALFRLLEGTYGVCVDCDKLISRARLKVKPEAAWCTECQSAREGTPVDT